MTAAELEAPAAGQAAAVRAPRPFLSGLFSLLVPGAGQMYAGRVRRGAIILATAVLAGAVALALAPGRQHLASTIVRPRVLTALLVADGLFLAFRLWAVVDAWLVASRRRPSSGTTAARTTAAGGLAFLALVTVVPHAAAGWAIVTTDSTLHKVFADDEPDDVIGGGTFDDPGPTFLEPAPGLTRKPSSAAAAQLDKGQWLNVLLIGGDAGYLRWGLRADTLVVVSIQKGTGRAVAFSIPRNLEYVPLYGRAAAEYGHFPDLINALYGFGQAHPDLFPGGRDPGATALKLTISNLLGIPIHYYVLVDLRGFVEVVDAFGGVKIKVTERLSDRTSPAFPGEPWTSLETYPGQVVHFDGRGALAYVRSRHQSSDYRRMIRQRCFLTAMADQLDPIEAIRHLGKLSRAAKQYVSTDVPLDRLPNLIELVAGINPWLSTGVSFTPPQYDTYRPDVQPYRDTVRHVLLTPPDKLLERYDLRTLAGSCRDGD